MNGNLEVMSVIQAEKQKEIEAGGQIPLDEEGIALAEAKRFTFDVTTTQVDPLR